MNIKDYDYNKHDKLVIVIKKTLKKQILSAYSFFKWKEVQSKKFLHLKGVEQIVLIRPHNIPNKDKVQYLQVCFERQLERVSKLYTFKNLKSIIFGLGVCILCFALILTGVITASALISLLGILAFILTVPVIFKLRKKENQIFRVKSQKILQESEEILQQVKVLLEENL